LSVLAIIVAAAAAAALSAQVAAARVARENGAKKSVEYWGVYRSTPLTVALDPSKGLLAPPPPTHPPLEPSPWLAAGGLPPAEQRLQVCGRSPSTAQSPS
jgi:hypothetical protein